jgi:uncharacterized protein (DUF736 family)
MAYEHKLNSGTLFNNNSKEKENHPDYKGTINIEGKLYDISGWNKVSSNGNAFTSLSIRPKQEKEVPNFG